MDALIIVDSPMISLIMSNSGVNFFSLGFRLEVGSWLYSVIVFAAAWVSTVESMLPHWIGQRVLGEWILEICYVDMGGHGHLSLRLEVNCPAR